MEECPGFIISSARTLEKNASSEIYYVLSELLEQSDIDVSPITGISGLSIATFQEDSVETLLKIKEMIEDNPIFQYTLKIVPVKYRIGTSLDNLKEAASVLSSEILADSTWKISMRRRHTQIPRTEIIGTIANEINKGKVMLDSPDYYIIVEVIGKWTYLAVSSIDELPISVAQFHEEEDEFTF